VTVPAQGAPGIPALQTSPAARAVPGQHWLGVLGGGQLGRMFVHAAQRMGFRVAVLDPDPASPAAAAADLHLQAAYDDPQALHTLQARCAAVTTEFENVPAAALQQLAARVPTSPSAAAVRICQHRAAEKRLFVEAGVPCAPHAVVAHADDLAAAARAVAFPAILKTAQLGYDGKGQQSVADPAALPAAWQALGRVPCVLEQRMALQQELSVIVARGVDGQVVHLPVQHNVHRDGILALTQVPAPGLSAALAQQAVDCALALARRMDYVGVLCVEFFVLQDGRLLANEMAPRPHNSGHASIDACDVSQFDLQVRTLAGLPLVAPRQHSHAVMLNLLGDLWFAEGSGAATPPPWSQLLRLSGVHLHLYGKSEPRRGRKMGHLTVTAADADAARDVALQAGQVLGLSTFQAGRPCPAA
jgi:5-(carboxyamino)imidazole ribonucleotide synthase